MNKYLKYGIMGAIAVALSAILFKSSPQESVQKLPRSYEEIIRSGIQSIDGGQTEASRSLGLSKGKTMLYIILPQALRNILPAIANEFVVIIKESAIAYTIGVPDIMAAVNDVRSATFTIMEPLLIATGIYFCLCFPTSKIIAYFERRMSRGNVR